MRIDKVNLPEPSQLTEDYINGDQNIQGFFDYNYNDTECFSQRLQDLNQRNFQRKELVEYLKDFNSTYNPHSNVMQNIEKLREEQTVCIVGGQQAGLLTGPIYSIHKCISIIQLAKEQSKKLGVPVIPVFWIAGEDHDYDEVNHVFAYDHDSLRKYAYHQADTGANSLSNIKIDHQRLTAWIDQVFQAFGETQNTKELLKEVHADAQQSSTFIDFFARQLHRLFGKHGLVLLDSGDKRLRELEKDFFQILIKKSEHIASGVVQQIEALKEKGYSVNLDQSLDSANLFILDQEERILLHRKGNDYFVNENKGFTITEADLTKIAKESPGILSNNVVTRPLMQEFLLPTLAFIGGGGEIAYWSCLKRAFYEVDFKMPPVLLRHRFILTDRKIDRWLDDKQLTSQDALSETYYQEKEKWLREQHQWDVEEKVEETKRQIALKYEDLAELAREVDPELKSIADKNLELIQKQLDYMEKTINRKIRREYGAELKKFDRVKACLLPDGKPQERVWSAFYFINYWGAEWVDELIHSPLEFDGIQRLVHI